MATTLNLYETLLRLLEYAEMDANFKNLRTTADAALPASTAAETYSPKGGPGSGQAFAVGSLTAADTISTSKAESPFTSIVAGSSRQLLRLGNTGGTALFGMESSPATAVVGASAYDTILIAPTGLSVSANNGASLHARLDSTGNLLVGVSSGTCHTIAKAGVAGALILGVGPTAGNSHRFFVADAGSASASTTAYSIDKISATGRSINAAGTINASGADYAEYENKSASCDQVIKGQIVGFDTDGNITDKWANAVSFGVKSTNPNLVGGDTWGNENAVGKRPEQPIRVPDTTEQRLVSAATEGQEAVYETVIVTAGDTDNKWLAKESQYANDLAIFEAKLETARQKVDRIAYSGKVPCNVIGASVGDYIIAVQAGENIKGVAVSTPTFEQYSICVGRVRRILDDGRAEIAVIVH